MLSSNSLDYCTFICAFETVMETSESDYTGRLYYLEQQPAGKPHELVCSCLYMDAERQVTERREAFEE